MPGALNKFGSKDVGFLIWETDEATHLPAVGHSTDGVGAAYSSGFAGSSVAVPILAAAGLGADDHATLIVAAAAASAQGQPGSGDTSAGKAPADVGTSHLSSDAQTTEAAAITVVTPFSADRSAADQTAAHGDQPAAQPQAGVGFGGGVAADAAGVAGSAGSMPAEADSGAVTSPETVTYAGSGLVFINSYDVSVTDAYRTAIIYAENELQSHFTNPVTLRVSFGFQNLGAGFLAQNSFFNTSHVSYATLKAALTSHATSADDIAAVNALPTADPSGGTGYLIAAGMSRILGFTGAGSTTDDRLVLGTSFTWNFDPNNRSAAGGYDAIGAIEHELSEGGMGRVGGLGYQNSTWAPMDPFRFNAAGVRNFTGGQDGVETYFSPNGSAVDLTHPYHKSINAAGAFDGQDPADWNVGGDAFGFGSPGVPGLLSNTDIRVMDVLGWTLTSTSYNWGRNGATDYIANFTGTGGKDILEIGPNGKQFEWTANASSISSYSQWGTGGSTLDKVGDFNGDGKSDMVQLFDGNQRAYVWLSNGAGFNPYTSWGTGFTSADRVGDFNGDGRDDIIQVLPGNQNIYIWTSNGTSFNPVAVWGTGSLPADKFADVNEAGAGGSADLVQFLDGSQKAYVATSNGANHFNAWSVWGTGFTSSDRLADFNGDGRADAIQILPGNQNAYVWLSTGTSFAPFTVWGSGFTPGDQFADITGDGKQDMIQILSNGNVYAWTSTGSAFSYKGLVAQGALGARIADMNGDGRSDLIQLTTDGTAYVWLANGTGGFGGYTVWGKGLPGNVANADGGGGTSAEDAAALRDFVQQLAASAASPGVADHVVNIPAYTPAAPVDLDHIPAAGLTMDQLGHFWVT